MLKVIKNEEDYQEDLSRIEELIDLSPEPGTTEADELGVLAVLVQEYESKAFPVELPDPIEAIRFRMEQQNLSPRDLIPYIGSRSKVSEVLSGKRSLTLSMIRALHFSLGIPAKVLLQGRNPNELEDTAIDWNRFPLREMVKRNWIKAKPPEMRDHAESLLHKFFAPLGGEKDLLVVYTRASHVRSARSMNQYALTAWCAHVMIRGFEEAPTAPYRPGVVDLNFMRKIVELSSADTGPLLARDFLREHGILLIIEPHLPRTYLDGTAIKTKGARPIIGLTLRYDRIDNFWFSLIHELSHIALHFDKEGIQFFDDLTLIQSDDPLEQEADRLAGEALISDNEWRNSSARLERTSSAVRDLADKLHIHPAIVAGRIRYRCRDYRLLNNLVGHRQVRRLFPEISWEKIG